MSARLLIRATLAVAFAAIAFGGAAAQQQAGGLIKPGSDPGLHLIYTGDVIGYLEPCG